MGKARDRDTNLRRRAPNRAPRHRILIVCEGKKTEPRYFRELQHHFRNRLIHVEVNDESGVPSTLVQRAELLRDAAVSEARAQRDDNLRFDEIWCVCDVDEHPHLDKACARASEQRIHIALSNPCFELWGLLHFREQSKALHRHEAQRDLRKLLGVKEDKLIPLEKLHAGYGEAVQRARALRKTAEATEQQRRNPGTNVDELTERIRLAGQ